MIEKLTLERTILGNLISHEHTRDIAVELKLRSDDFSNPDHVEIYNVFVKALREYKHFDLTLLRKALKDNQSDIKIDDVRNMVTEAKHPDNFESHVKALKDESVKVKLDDLCIKTRMRIAEKGTGSEVIADTMNSISEILEGSVVVEEKSFADFFMLSVKEMEENAKRGDSLFGLSTGLFRLDKVTGGLANRQFTVIAAGSGEGKSTLALNIAYHNASHGVPVLFFNLEMGGEELVYKILSSELEIPVKDVRLGKADLLDSKLGNITRTPLHIIPNADITIDEIVAISKKKIKKDGIKLIIVDYLQLVDPGMHTRKLTKADQVGSVSRKLKILSKTLDVPVIALSQLNREKNRSTYTLDDLRDSGQIGQDADNVIFIFIPQKHDMTSYQVGEETKFCTEEDAVIKIGKCRLGATGLFFIKFKGEYSKFVDPEDIFKK